MCCSAEPRPDPRASGSGLPCPDGRLQRTPWGGPSVIGERPRGSAALGPSALQRGQRSSGRGKSRGPAALVVATDREERLGRLQAHDVGAFPGDVGTCFRRADRDCRDHGLPDRELGLIGAPTLRTTTMSSAASWLFYLLRLVSEFGSIGTMAWAVRPWSRPISFAHRRTARTGELNMEGTWLNRT
jgi:hypothetical protein